MKSHRNINTNFESDSYFTAVNRRMKPALIVVVSFLLIALLIDLISWLFTHNHIFLKVVS